MKLLQSEGALAIASTGKDPSTGKLVTHQYRVEGPVMIFLTTTAIRLDEELLNRCLVLTVNEDRSQTKTVENRGHPLFYRFFPIGVLNTIARSGLITDFYGSDFGDRGVAGYVKSGDDLRKTVSRDAVQV